MRISNTNNFKINSGDLFCLELKNRTDLLTCRCNEVIKHIPDGIIKVVIMDTKSRNSIYMFYSNSQEADAESYNIMFVLPKWFNLVKVINNESY